MKNATFYLLDNDTQQDGLSAVEQLVCEIAAERWRAGKRVLIACENEKQALRLDEALWARIAWPEKRNSSPRDLLISLRVGFADFATAFTEVIDFVPYEDSLKQSARDRYKAYRVAGFNLNTATWK
ncbi:MAG: DNA polymerase III subunit chi [Citrobacter freundii]|nr:DNA polymerase III subunit chi [Citrobacter freundii]